MEKQTQSNSATKSSKNGFIILAIALITLLAIAAFAYTFIAPMVSSITSESDLEPAPNITMTSADEDEVTLDSLYDKPVVLNFWASTCGPCKNEMPYFQEAYEQYGDKINFAMVNIIGFRGETQFRANSFITQNNYTFPVYFDISGDASVAYEIDSIPRTYFITRNGNVMKYAIGGLDKETIFECIDLLL